MSGKKPITCESCGTTLDANNECPNSKCYLSPNYDEGKKKEKEAPKTPVAMGLRNRKKQLEEALKY